MDVAGGFAVLEGARLGMKAIDYYQKAKTAYKVGKGIYNLSKNNSTMATQKRKYPSTPPRTPAKRRRVSVSSVRTQSSRRSSVSQLRGVMKTEQSVGQTAMTTRVKTLKKQFKGKRKAKVHVSSALRKKVLKVFDSKMISGNGRVIWCGLYRNINPPSPILQDTFPLPTPRGTNVQQGALFTPEYIMYVASRLWNGRLYEGTGLTLGQWANVLVDQNTVGTYEAKWANFTVGLSGFPSAFKVDVTDLKAKITMKNNGSRTAYLKFYMCKPKYQRKETGAAEGLPLADWKNGLANDGTANIKGLNNSVTVASNVNIARRIIGTIITPSVTVDTMYATPAQCQAFKRQWNVNEVAITLEPGQTHVHWVQGDCKEYDFSKMVTKTSTGAFEFNNIQKTDVHCFYTAVNEMAFIDNASPTADIAGRLLSGDKSNILFEVEKFCTMKMPETAGTSVFTGGSQVLDQATMHTASQRKRGYFVDTYYPLGADNLTPYNINVDDNNPTTNRIDV